MLRQIIISFFVICICLMIFLNSTSQAQSQKKILILHSYHQGYTWTDQIMKGIISNSNLYENPIEYYVEYLDAMRFSQQKSFENIYLILRHKYLTYRFDCIIASDDPSLKFLIANRTKLFPDIPIVFCGINDEAFAKDHLQKNIFGVIEKPNILKTVELALKLHPNCKRIIAVCDHSNEGMIHLTEFRHVSSKLKYRVEFMEYDNMALPELKENVRSLTLDDVLLLLTVTQYQSILRLNYIDTVNTILQKTNCPVYSLWAPLIGHGIIGGMMERGIVHGKNAADIVSQLLTKGKNHIQNALIMDTPKNYMFDYAQLSRFNISHGKLPKKSIIFNEPAHWITTYKNLLLSIIILGLFGLMGYCVIIMSKLNHAKNKIHTSESRLRDIIDYVPQMIAVKDRNGRFLLVNLATAIAYATPIEELTGSFVAEHHRNKEELLQFLEEDKHVIDSRQLKVISEHFFTGADGKKRIMQTVKIPYRYAEGGKPAVLSVSVDITSIANSDEVLRKSENYFRALVEEQPDAVCRFKPDGTLTFVNESFCKLLGHTVQSCIHRHLFIVISKQADLLIEQLIKSLNKNNPIMTHQITIKDYLGQDVETEWSNRAIFDIEDNIVEIQSVIRQSDNLKSKDK